MKSLFWRYLTMTLLLLLISFSLFAVMFIWQSYNYTLGELQTMLKEDSNRVSQLTSLFLKHTNTRVTGNPMENALNSALNSAMNEVFRESIRSIAERQGEHIIICLSSGQIFLYANEKDLQTGFGVESRIPANIMMQILESGEYWETGTLGGSYNYPCYTYGYVVESETGSIIAAAFVSAPTIATKDKFEYYQHIFLVIGAVVLIIGTFISYLVARNMAHPLRMMTKATRAYAMGDFSLQIPEDRMDEIGELAHSLNQMSASLNKIEELRSSFIANVSHELKTPMTTIAGFAEGILDGTIPPEREREYLKIISSDTRRLSRLVVRMLDASRLSAGEITLHSAAFDICEMIRLNILEFEHRILEKNLHVDVYFENDTMVVMADQDNIAQVVYNLMDNACKYSCENGELRISVTLRGDKVHVAISNQGNTIPADKLPYIFDRFYKTDQSRGLDSNSMGLGLFIVKSILNMHNEEIAASSENGVTVFSFTLPVVTDYGSGRGGANKSV